MNLNVRIHFNILGVLCGHMNVRRNNRLICNRRNSNMRCDYRGRNIRIMLNNMRANLRLLWHLSRSHINVRCHINSCRVIFSWIH